MTKDELTKTHEELSKYKDLVDDLQSFKPVSGSFESEFEEKDNIIKGDALGTGTWNLFYYSSEELKKASDDLKGVDVVIGHGKEKEDEVGEVIDSRWNDNREVIEFTAKIDSDDVIQMVKRGVVDSVSVGLEFDKMMSEHGRSAVNLDFYELALVNEPAFIDGIHEIIDKEIDEENEEPNELSEGGVQMTSKDNRVIIALNKKIIDELEDSDNVEVKGELYGYPGPEGYYPKEEGYGYPSSKISSIVSMLLERIRRLEEETGIEAPEYEEDYGYPEKESDEQSRNEVLAVEVDEAKAESIIEDLSGDIADLVDEVGYPGPETEVADILEDVNDRIESLEKELGL